MTIKTLLVSGIGRRHFYDFKFRAMNRSAEERLGNFRLSCDDLCRGLVLAEIPTCLLVMYNYILAQFLSLSESQHNWDDNLLSDQPHEYTTYWVENIVITVITFLSSKNTIKSIQMIFAMTY